MTHEAGHDPADVQHPGDVANEPHGLDDHGEDDGHDDHAHADEELGPPDPRVWGAFVLGVGLGLVPVLGILLATAG